MYPFRSKPVSDTDPKKFFHDVSVHGLGRYGEVTVPDGCKESKELLEAAAEKAQERVEILRERGVADGEKVKREEEIEAKLKREAEAVTTL